MTSRAVLAAIVAVVCGGLVLVVHLWAAPDRFEVDPSHPLAAYAGRTLRNPIEMLAAEADGSSFLLLAADPTLGNAATDFGDPGHAAYRAQRIVPAMLTRALGGSPAALAVVVVAGLGLMAAAMALLAPRAGAVTIGLITAANPASLATVEWLSSESLAAGFGLWGLVAWRRDRKGWASACWAAAILCRDTAVVFALAAVLDTAIRRPVDRGVAGRKFAHALAVPVAAYLGWAFVVHFRIGRWPWGGGAESNLSLVPFGPLLRGDLGRLDASVAPSLIVLALIAVGAWWVRRLPELRSVTWTHVLVLAGLGPVVWARWDYFARLVSVPLIVAGLGAVDLAARMVRRDAPTPQNIRSTSKVVAPIVSGG